LGLAAMGFPVQGPKASAGAVSDSNQVTGSEIVAYGKQYLGYPYAHTGSAPKTGFSCIGFVYYVFQHFNIDMPGNLGSALVSYRHVPEQDLLPGDIIFFQNTWWKGVSHVAIYIGHGRVLHAENPRRGVNISRLSNDPQEGDYWQQHYLVGERPLDGESHSSPPTTDHVIDAKGPKAVVDVPTLNFRSDHSMNATVVTVLPQGTSMVIVGQWHRWFNVALSDGTTGWVVKAGVRVRSASHPKSHPDVGKLVATVEVNGLHVHNKPSVAASIVASLKFGQKVDVLKKVRGWYEVSVNGLLHGWSVQEYLKPVASRPRSKASAFPMYGVMAGVNVHRAPSLSATVIATTVKGEAVTIRKRHGLFVHIMGASGQDGWILARFITGLIRPTKSPKSKNHPIAKRRAQPRGSLTIKAHLRTGPSLSAHILQWVAAGTSVSILGSTGLWDRVRIPSQRTGYVYAQFIHR
jgi:uncharacterized protein YgiM (DUF1202 family)